MNLNDPALAEITSIAEADQTPEAIYLLAPTQWKIGAGREIRLPFLVCSEATYLSLCKQFNRNFDRVEVSAFGKRYVVFEVE